MDDNKIKTPENFLEKFEKVTKVLSFEKDSDVVILSVGVKDFTPDALKAMVKSIENATGHKCIVIPDTVYITTGNKDQVIQGMENTIKRIKEIPDLPNRVDIEISW